MYMLFVYLLDQSQIAAIIPSVSQKLAEMSQDMSKGPELVATPNPTKRLKPVKSGKW